MHRSAPRGPLRGALRLARLVAVAAAVALGTGFGVAAAGVAAPAEAAAPAGAAAALDGGAARARGRQEVSTDPLGELATLTRALERATEPDPAEVLQAEVLFHDLRILWSAQPARQGEICDGVADWVGTVRLRAAGERGGRVERRTADRAVEWFAPRLDGPLVADLGRELARRDDPSGVVRRTGLAALLAASADPGARMALFAATRDDERLVRDTAVAGLAGRDDQAVHTRLVELLEAAEAGEVAIRMGAVEDHFRAARIGRTDAAFARVLYYVRKRLVADDWRRASRAISVGTALPDEVMLGPLIEALPVWMEREEAGLQAKRIQGDLLDELHRRTGRKLGLHPERWRQLFDAVRRGDVQLAGPEGDADGRPRTEASFFGLRPWTDRVTFVIDRSGSMDNAYRRSPDETSPPSRYSAAIRQMTAFLEELGPKTRFDVVLFSSDAARWRRELVPATPDNLASVAAWAAAAETGGGTFLRKGIDLAARVDKDGAIDLAKLESDTIIVLCDGDTDEGSGWVAGFLRSTNDVARLRYHAVQIGGAGDGTLRALCEGSGGDYVHDRR